VVVGEGCIWVPSGLHPRCIRAASQVSASQSGLATALPSATERRLPRHAPRQFASGRVRDIRELQCGVYHAPPLSNVHLDIVAMELAPAARQYLWHGLAPGESVPFHPAPDLWHIALGTPFWMNPLTMMRRLLSLAGFVASSLQASLNYSRTNTSRPDLSAPLTFTANGAFRISIFEDLHFGESECLTPSPVYPLTCLTRLSRCLG
jgi:hypothetical protein